jgi:enediyne biosynthesis thioesterase
MENRTQDRRTNQIIVERRQFNRREKEFLFEKRVYLTDTNAMGNTYFANYFDWQGMIREDFVRYILPDYAAFLRTGIKLITLEASMKYYYESILFDDVIIKMKLNDIKKTSIELLFTFTNKTTGKLLGEGRQKIAFASPEGRYIPVPMELVQAAKSVIKDLPV